MSKITMRRRIGTAAAPSIQALPTLPQARVLASMGAVLCAYYMQHKRNLPWRATTDPYAIWVSEIMLQQTQVDTVVPRYHAFLAQFPSVATLAAADAQTVCQAWAGLGYYRRARLMHMAAQSMVRHNHGQLPSTLTELLRLPGIGRYTAGAIASIAFKVPAPLVDGNVARVLSRILQIPCNLDAPFGQKALWAAATALIEAQATWAQKDATPSCRDPGVLNQALMELGATWCRPKAPLCLMCPVKKMCGAHINDTTATLPPKKMKAKTQAMAVAYALCIDPKGGGLMLRQRPLDGLWGGLWDLPGCEGKGAKTKLLAMGFVLGEVKAVIEHTLTHRRVKATVYWAKRWPQAFGKVSLRPFVDAERQPISALARKAIVASYRPML